MTSKSLFVDYKFSLYMIRSMTTLCAILFCAALFASAPNSTPNLPTPSSHDVEPPVTASKEGNMIISYVATKPSCAGGADGTIEVTIFGANPPFTYVWGNGTANQALDNISAGTYTVVATDATGATHSETIVLQDNPPLGLLMEKTDGVCAGACDGVAKAIVSGGVGPFTYTWSDGFTGGAVNAPLPIGWIAVTVTDANGCAIQDSVEIGEPTPVVIGINSVAGACGGNSGNATVNASGGIPPYNYLWNYNNVTGPTLSGAPAGTYFVVVSDANGCQTDTMVTIDAGTGLNLQMNTTSALCTGQSTGTATVAVLSGSGTYSYAWDVQPGINSPSITGLSAGAVITVTVTDIATGCQGIATQSISGHTAVNIITSAVGVDCANNPTGSITAQAVNGTAPYSYAWDINGTTVTDPQVTGLTSGTYFVTATDANGCTSNSGVNVPAMSSLNADIQTSPSTCVNNQVEISFSDASFDPMSTITDWQWNITWPNGGNATFNTMDPGVLTLPENVAVTVDLTVTSAMGCTDNTTATIQTPGLPNIGLNVSSPAVSCDGQPIPVQVTGGQANYTYTWTPSAGVTQVAGATNVTLDPNISATYMIQANDAGCSKVVDVNLIVAPDMALSAAADIMNSCNPSETLTATATGATSYEWFLNNQSVGTGSTINVTPSGMATYTVIATDQYGCTASDDQAVSGDAVDIDLNTGTALSDCENTPLNISFTNNDPTDVITHTWAGTGLTIADPNAVSTTINGATGMYTVFLYAANQNGCTDTLEIAVDYAPGDSLNPFAALDLCNGLDVDFEMNTSLSGVWDFGDGNTSTMNTVTHNYANSGMYTVTYTPTNATCTGVYEEMITVTDDPAVAADYAHDLQSCEDEAIFDFTDLSNTINTINTWEWVVNGQTLSDLQNPTLSFDTIGPISVTLYVTDVNNCKDSLNKEIPYHIVTEDIDVQQQLCLGDSVELNSVFNLDYDYKWTSSPIDPGLDTSNPNPIVMPSVNTTYTVTITLGGCAITKTVDVAADQPAQLTTPADDDVTVCDDTPITLTASSSNGTVEWSESPDFTPSVISNTYELNPPTRFGIYYVRSLTPAGCEKMDTIKVHNGAIDVTPSQNQDFRCIDGNDPVELAIQNNIMDDMLTYSWDNGILNNNANQSVLPNEDVVYTATIGNNWGCVDTVQFEVDVIELSVDVTTDVDTICPGQEAILTASPTGGSIYTYEWQPSADVVTGFDEAIATVSPEQSTDFEVLVTDENGCSITGTVPIGFLAITCDFPYIFVPSAFTPNGDGENEFFMVRGLNITELLFVVYNRWGEEMYRTTDPAALGWDGTYKNRELTADSYGWYVRLRCDDGAEFIDKGSVTLLK